MVLAHGICLLQQVGTLPLVAAFSIFRALLDFIRSELLGDGRPYGASCCRRRLSVPSGAEVTQMGQRQRSWFRFLQHARRADEDCGAAASVRSRPSIGSEGPIGLRRDHCALKLPRRQTMPPFPVAACLPACLLYLPAWEERSELPDSLNRRRLQARQ